jgi:hypothetical protein
MMLRSAAVILLFLFPFDLRAQTTHPSSRPGGGVVAPPRRDVPGKRTTLPAGELFIPDFVQPDAQGHYDLAIWFLGATWCAEQVFYDAHKNAALLVVNSATLKRGFPEPGQFDDLLKETDLPTGKLVLVSFSGGYTAVRDLLRHGQVAGRISDVVLLDSLYAPRLGGKEGPLDPAAMKPFVDFAQRATDGKTTFLFSQLYPTEEQYRGNTTTLAATFLIDELHLERKTASGKTSRGSPILYRADQKNCHIVGYAGMTNQDHFDHFYAAADLLKRTSLEDAK